MFGLFKLIALAALIRIPLAQAAPSPEPSPDQSKLIPGQYIVVLNDDADVLGVIKGLAPDISDNIEFVYEYALKGFSGKFDQASLSVIRLLPVVDFVEQDALMHTAVVQSPAPYDLGITSEQGGHLSFAEQRSYHYQNPTNPTYPIYVIDTGVDGSDAQFQGRAKEIKSFIKGEPDKDLNGHGTNVAGIAIAKTFGVCKFCRVFGIKVLNQGGSGQISGIIAGINYAVNHAGGQPAVINLSIDGDKSHAVNKAVDGAVSQGVTTAVAAGNSDESACFFSPASSKLALTVAAIDRRYMKANFSNFGHCVDIFAPGVDIESTYLANTTHVLSGTSQATPHISGLAAYFMGVFGVTDPGGIRMMFENTGKRGLVENPSNAPNLLANNGFYQ